MNVYILLGICACVSFSAWCESPCQIRDRSVAYDIEIEWEAHPPTKIKNIRLVYGLIDRMSNLFNKTPMRQQQVPMAIATVQLPENGIEAADFAEQQFLFQESQKSECGTRWFCQRSYIGKLGFASPLQLQSSTALPKDLALFYDREKMRFSKIPNEQSLLTPASINGMNYDLAPNYIDQNVIRCLASEMLQKNQVLSFVGQCKIPYTPPTQYNFNGSTGDYQQMLGIIGWALIR